MHRASAFFSWLLASHPTDAEAFRAFGLPTNTSRLYVLLRACKHGGERIRVRQWHQRWRTHRKEHERLVRIKRLDADLDLTPIPDDGFIRGIKRSGEITFELNFVTNPDPFQDLWERVEFLQGYYSSKRWNRVARRWEAKHR